MVDWDPAGEASLTALRGGRVAKKGEPIEQTRLERSERDAHELTTNARPLRIWHIAESYPPDYGGGATMYLHDICTFLGERGHEVRVLCSEGTDKADYSIRTEFDGPVRIDRLNLPYFKRNDPGGWLAGSAKWNAHSAKLAALAAEMMRAWKPDIVQFHTPHPISEEFVLALVQLGLPVIGLSHCAWTICPRLNLLQSPSASACTGPARLKCLYCLYSNYDGSHARALAKLPWRLLKLGTYPAARLARRDLLRRSVLGQVSYSRYMTTAHAGNVSGSSKYIGLGINTEAVPTARPTRPRAPLRLGFMAGFQPHKGIWDLLETAAELKREGLTFELHIWGPDTEGRSAEVSARGLDHTVVLHGTFSAAEKWVVFNSIDVLVMATTVVEAYGRVVQEAAAVGVPTVAPAVGGITEQIRDNVDGMLYRFRDRLDLKAKLARIIANPELVADMAAALRPVVNTRDAVVQLESFYYEVLDGIEH